MRKKLETFNRMVGTGVIENKTSEQVTNILNLFGTNSGNDNNYNPKIDIVA
ncbi:MAG: hypothetical protein LBQ24_03060 [Candidatus Peribacteria bacterium]|jgi:hypothetical protein|nr:hypothetical protein [Candidatus Peribacteria bacterium]